MTLVGFVGLGQMGRHMAANLAKAGVELIVSSREGRAFADLEKLGVQTSRDLRALSTVKTLFLCLPDTAAVEEVLLGERGLAAALHPGSLVVDFSTISYTTTLRIAEALGSRNLSFLDAPISGMEARARDGTLTIMCGGDKNVLERARPLLRLVGDTILHMGASGSGQLAKLVNQLLFDINVAALAEILPMAVKMGLDAAKVAVVVNSGTGRSFASEFFVPRMLDGKFGEGYPLAAAYKDLVSAAELAMPRSIPHPVLSAATATYQQALLRGLGHLDKGAMIQVFEQLLGVEFRSGGDPAARSCT